MKYLITLLITALIIYQGSLKAQYTSLTSVPTTVDMNLEVGNTPSSTSVADDGSAVVNIPIQLPDGTAGKKPVLSLSYSSNAGDGNFGFGWNLTGLSVISRGNHQKFFDDDIEIMENQISDAYYLDGQRLVHTGGTYGQDGGTYRTRVDNHETVTVVGSNGSGPKSFKIEKRNGITYEYGTKDSCILHHPDGTKMVWPLTRIIDCQGNYITYEYRRFDQELVLSKISYTGNDNIGLGSYNSVEFKYQAGDYQSKHYMNGEIAFKRKKLLTEIVIKEYSNVYKKYLLEYMKYRNKNHLFSVQECGSSTCLNPTYFDYTLSSVMSTSTTTNIDLGLANSHYYTAELNQDGFDDIIRLKYACTNGNCVIQDYQMRINDPENPGTFSSQNLQNVSINTDISYSFSMMSNGLSLAEFNGDGISDILMLSTEEVTINSNSNPVLRQDNVYVRHSPILNNDVYSSQDYQINGFDYVPEPTRDNLWNNVISGDFNGDSKTDVMTIHYNGDEDPLDWVYNVRMHAGGGIEQTDRNRIVNNQINSTEIPWNIVSDVSVIDYDGNGDSELMFILASGGANCMIVLDYTYNTNSNEWEIEVLYTGGSIQPFTPYYVGDFNGDRISDFYAIQGGVPRIWYGRGNGTYNSGYQQSPWIGSLPASYTNLIVMDTDGDGLDDIVVNHATDNIKVYINEECGNSFQQSFDTEFYEDKAQIGKYLLGNFRGKTQPSMIVDNGFVNSSNIEFDVLNFGNKNRLLNLVRDGFGNETTFDFKTLAKGATSSSSLYSIGTGASFPLNDVHYAIPVVSELNTPDGLDGQLTTSYSYAGAKLHRQGFGMIGFESVEETYSWNSLRSVKKFEIDVASMSMRLESNYIEDISGTLTAQAQQLGNKIKETKYEYSDFFYTNAPFHYYVNLSKTWELDYLSGSETYTKLIFDNIGLLGSEFKDIGRDFNGANNTGIIQVNKLYEGYNVLCNSMAGKPLEIYTTTKRQNSLPYDYDESYTQNPITGNLIETEKFLNKPKKLTTTYSNFYLGMPQYIITSSPGLTQRSTQKKYDSQGRWIVNSANALGQWQAHDDVYSGAHGKIEKNEDLTGLEIFYEYDEFHRVKKITNALGNVTDITYEWVNSTGNGSSTTTADNAIYKVTKDEAGKPKIVSYYDKHGQLRMTETQGFSTSEIIKKVITYNAEGQVIDETLPFKANASTIVHTNYVYDDLGRIESESTTGVGLTDYEYTYDPHVHITKVTDPSGEETITKTDVTGKVIQVTDNGGTLDYTYNSQNLLIEVSQNNTAITTMTYDDYGRQTSLVEQSSGGTTYEYNAYGELTQQSTGSGSFPVSFQYDVMGRMISKTDNSGTTSYQYVSTGNGLNQIKQIQALGEVKEYEYDNFNRVSEIKYPTQNIIQANSYDAYGNLERRNINNGEQEFFYSYSSKGYLYKKASKANYESAPTEIHWTLNINAFGGITDMNGLFSTTQLIHGRDEYNLPTEVSYGTYYIEDYVWDNTTGNLDSRSFNGGGNPSETFDYDNQYRLTKATINGNVACSTEFSATGNCTKNLYAVGDINYGSSQYQAGMVINSPSNISLDEREITYTAFNEPEIIEEGDYRMKFQYGVNQTRIKSELFYQNQLIETRTYFPELGYETTTNHQANRKYHLYYESIDGKITAMVVKEEDLNTSSIVTQPGDAYHTVVTDYLGSILRVYDNTNTLVAKQSFSAWGRYRNADDWTFTTTSFTNPDWLIRGYTGHEQLDEFALIHMNGRLYCPLTTRMLSPDNYVQLPYSTQNYNRYSYAFNNPMRYTDPSGEFTVRDGVALGMIAGGAALFFAAGGATVFSGGALAGPAAIVAGLGVSMILGGVSHFMQAATLAQNNGTTWNQASRSTYLGISVSANVGATTGPSNNSSPSSSTAGTGGGIDYTAVDAARGYEENYHQFESGPSNWDGMSIENQMGPELTSTEDFGGVHFTESYNHDNSLEGDYITNPEFINLPEGNAAYVDFSPYNRMDGVTTSRGFTYNEDGSGNIVPVGAVGGSSTISQYGLIQFTRNGQNAHWDYSGESKAAFSNFQNNNWNLIDQSKTYVRWPKYESYPTNGKYNYGIIENPIQ